MARKYKISDKERAARRERMTALNKSKKPPQPKKPSSDPEVEAAIRSAVSDPPPAPSVAKSFWDYDLFGDDS